MTRPLITYRGSFQPHPVAGELVAASKRPDGCMAQNEGALMLSGRAELARELAAAVGVARSLVAMWQSGKRIPVADCRATIEKLFGIPKPAWGLWRPEGAVVSEAAPASERRPVVVAKPREEPREEVAPVADPSPFPTPTDGSVIDRARAMLAYLAVPGRTAAELAQAKEIRAALTFEARLMGAMQTKAGLQDHPEFAGFLDALMAEVGSLPGGLDALERAAATLAAPADEKAAAA